MATLLAHRFIPNSYSLSVDKRL